MDARCAPLWNILSIAAYLRTLQDFTENSKEFVKYKGRSFFILPRG